MVDARRNLVFLPGAAGAADFWRPVASLLPAEWRKTLLSWPGAGVQPHHPSIAGFNDLITRTASGLPAGSDLVAQSMGGVVALGIALRHPDLVRRLVLIATSGGIDVGELGGEDWREQYAGEYPDAAAWITEERVDYTDAIPAITAPTLLIWGDADPVSPLAAGRRLARLLPDCELHVMPGGTHSLAHDRAAEVALLIEAHLK